MNSEKKEQINGNNGHILNEKKTNFKEKKPSKIEFLEISANTVNHALIAITSFYITWYCYHEGFKEYQFFHGWFATIGYQLFMSEGIMAMYNRNSYTMFIEKRRSKVWVHLSLMVIGSGFALFAIPYQFIKREQLGKHHLDNKHAVFGLISLCLLCLTLVSGLSAFFAMRYRGVIKPILNKSMHNFTAVLCYIFGMVAIINAYFVRSELKRSDPGNVRYVMIWCLSCILVITLVGPLKSLFQLFFRR